jgi:DMSO/TMAO reductase YedYZ heme-binding membrane subunit
MVAWVLLTLAVLWGFFLSSRVLGRRPSLRWLLDLHRFFGGLAVIFVLVHLLAILVDSYVEFSLVQLLVPMTSDYRPAAVAWGIVAFYLLLAIELTSLVMKRLPRRTWHLIHLLSYPLFALATVHVLTAGTDVQNLAVRLLVIVAATEVTVLVVIRLLWRKHERFEAHALATGTAASHPPMWAHESMPTSPPVDVGNSPPSS